MKTLYIDVYFMINFTVDILAVFIAARMIHTGITVKRLVLSGIIGAIYATAELFLDDGILHVILAASFLLLILHISCRQASLLRKVKFLLSFYIASFLISGAVSFIYNVMDRYIDDLPIDTSNSTNRKAIIFSLIILLMIVQRLENMKIGLAIL